MNKINVPKNLDNYIPISKTKGGTIFRSDYFSINSIVYFTTLTIITIITFIYGYKILLDITTNDHAYLLFIGILSFIYIMFLGMYYLNWSLESVFVLILIASVLIGLISFLVIYFGGEVCKELKKEGETNFMKYIFMFLELIVLYLGFYNYHQYTSWNIYDTFRFILMLIIIRTMYYIVRHYDLSIYKTIIDVTMVVVFYFNGHRMYKILNQPSGGSKDIINVSNIGNLKIINK